jgi:hypothetical protein
MAWPWELKMEETGNGRIFTVTSLFADMDTRRNKNGSCQERENWVCVSVAATGE